MQLSFFKTSQDLRMLSRSFQLLEYQRVWREGQIWYSREILCCTPPAGAAPPVGGAAPAPGEWVAEVALAAAVPCEWCVAVIDHLAVPCEWCVAHIGHQAVPFEWPFATISLYDPSSPYPIDFKITLWSWMIVHILSDEVLIFETNHWKLCHQLSNF